MESDNSGVTLGALKELKKLYTVNASRALGQNFLIDTNISRKIAESIPAHQSVIEVGPGIGSLTVPLARHSQSVYAIEFDQHILEPLNYILTQSCVSDNVYVINNDVMDVDLEKMCQEHQIETIIGNLPYNISAPLIANIARHVPSARTVVAMVQKEVGERLGAQLGTRQVSAISYKVQFYMDVTVLFSVPRQSFVPPPKVDSVVIKLVRRQDPPIDIGDDVEDFFAMIDSAFSQRRKMLRKSLAGLLGEKSEMIFHSADVEPTLRPEQCTLENFADLYLSYKEHNCAN